MRTQLKHVADPHSRIRLVGEPRPAPVRDLVTVPRPPAPVRHVLSQDLHDVGEDNPFHLQVWTTAYGNGAMTRDCVWVRGMYAMVVAVVEDRVVCIRQYKKAAEQVL